MTPKQQRIAIAEACGWGEDGEFIRNVIKRHDERVERAYYQDRPLPKGGVPDYLHDLNAMHEVEKVLSRGIGYHQSGGYGSYRITLAKV